MFDGLRRCHRQRCADQAMLVWADSEFDVAHWIDSGRVRHAKTTLPYNPELRAALAAKMQSQWPENETSKPVAPT